MSKLKNHFVDAQAAIEIIMRASVGSFDSANTAALFRGASALHLANDKVPSSTVDKLDSYLDNITAEAINKIDVLNRLVTNN